MIYIRMKSVLSYECVNDSVLEKVNITDHIKR